MYQSKVDDKIMEDDSASSARPIRTDRAVEEIQAAGMFRDVKSEMGKACCARVSTLGY
jgi:hypothetical protein